METTEPKWVNYNYIYYRNISLSLGGLRMEVYKENLHNYISQKIWSILYKVEYIELKNIFIDKEKFSKTMYKFILIQFFI